MISTGTQCDEQKKRDLIYLKVIKRMSQTGGWAGRFLYLRREGVAFLELDCDIAACPLRSKCFSRGLRQVELLDRLSRRGSHLDTGERDSLETDIEALLVIIGRKLSGDINLLLGLRQIRRQCASCLQRSCGCMLAAVA